MEQRDDAKAITGEQLEEREQDLLIEKLSASFFHTWAEIRGLGRIDCKMGDQQRFPLSNK